MQIQRKIPIGETGPYKTKTTLPNLNIPKIQKKHQHLQSINLFQTPQKAQKRLEILKDGRKVRTGTPAANKNYDFLQGRFLFTKFPALKVHVARCLDVFFVDFA